MSCAWFHSLENVPLKDGITDTLSQGHTHLQSLEECLDQRDTAPDTVCSKASLYTCASTYCLTNMCRAALCIKIHLGGYIYSLETVQLTRGKRVRGLLINIILAFIHPPIKMFQH